MRVAVGIVAFAMAAVAGAAGDLAQLGLAPLRAGGDTGGFALADAPREFEFPRDHGPHPEFRTEWWYLTGNLRSAAGERFGFELTFFRQGLAPPAGAAAAAPTSGPEPASGWRTNQAYAAHFAITDVGRGQFRFAQRYARGALGLAGAQAAPFKVWLNDWQLMQSAGTWTLRAQQKDYELELQAQPLTAPVLNGDRGLSVKSSEPGAASYYYSIPRVAVHGRLLREGKPVSVSGTAWLDREWGSGSLGRNEAGWDWFALQLQDGSALMFYALRSLDGSREAHSGGTWIDPAGHSRVLASKEVEITVGDHWTSRRGARYPSRWRVQVPALALDVDVKPVMADQELGTSPKYWEGAVDVSGHSGGRETSGDGYVELVGYPDEIAGQAK